MIDFKVIKNVKFHSDGTVASFGLDKPIETVEEMKKEIEKRFGWCDYCGRFHEVPDCYEKDLKKWNEKR